MAVSKPKNSRLRLDRRWVCLLLGLLLLPPLCGLGVWQLQRADEKQLWLERQQHQPRLEALPAQLNSLPQRVGLRLSIDHQRLLLLDNRTRDGRSGYELLALYQDQRSRRWGLVNLGWLASGYDRSLLPQLDQLQQQLSGTVFSVEGILVSSSEGLQLAEDPWADGWPKRIQQPDLDRLQALYQVPLIPAMLRLQQPLLADLDNRWSLVNMPPSKHLGYALQWFGLALALAGWLFWYGWLRRPVSEPALEL